MNHELCTFWLLTTLSDIQYVPVEAVLLTSRQVNVNTLSIQAGAVN
jgi:hypothetical protein